MTFSFFFSLFSFFILWNFRNWCSPIELLHQLQHLSLLVSDHRIGLHILHAARKESSRHLALAAVAVELRGACLHRVDTHTRCYLDGEGIALLLDELHIRHIYLEFLIVLCTCKVEEEWEGKGAFFCCFFSQTVTHDMRRTRHRPWACGAQQCAVAAALSASDCMRLSPSPAQRADQSLCSPRPGSCTPQCTVQALQASWLPEHWMHSRWTPLTILMAYCSGMLYLRFPRLGSCMRCRHSALPGSRLGRVSWQQLAARRCRGNQSGMRNYGQSGHRAGPTTYRGADFARIAGRFA